MCGQGRRFRRALEATALGRMKCRGYQWEMGGHDGGRRVEHRRDLFAQATERTALIGRRLGRQGIRVRRAYSRYASIVSIDPSGRYRSSVTLIFRRWVCPPEVWASW